MRIFVDTSVFFSGVYSARGYARDLLNLGADGRCDLLIHELVLEEMQRNLATARPDALEYFQEYLKFGKLAIVPDPSPMLLESVLDYVAQKDAIIVAAAIMEHQRNPINYFVTYDRKDILNPTVLAKSGLPIVTPQIAVQAM